MSRGTPREVPHSCKARTWRAGSSEPGAVPSETQQEPWPLPWGVPELERMFEIMSIVSRERNLVIKRSLRDKVQKSRISLADCPK